MDGLDASELDTTVRPLALIPDIVQPVPAVLSAVTGSSKATRIVVSEVALALSMPGAWPSASACDTCPVPSRTEFSSTTFAAAIASEPLALGGAPPGEKVITCVLVRVLPETDDIVRASPSTTSDV